MWMQKFPIERTIWEKKFMDEMIIFFIKLLFNFEIRLYSIMSQKKTTYIANVNFKRNENMNKSAILFDKLDQRIAN